MVKQNVLKERQQLAEDGVITVAIALNWEGQLVAKPELHLRGVVTTVSEMEFQKLVTQTIEQVLSDRWSEFAKPFDATKVDVDWVGVKTQLERTIVRILRRELQSNPLLVFLMQIPDEAVIIPRATTLEKPLIETERAQTPETETETPEVKLTGRRRPRTAARAAS